jgi:hypothetical protein
VQVLFQCAATALTVRMRGREAHVLRQALGLPVIAGRGVVGAPGSSRSLPIPPAPPELTRRQRHPHRSTAAPAEGLAGSGRAAGWTLGGRLRTMRASLSRTQSLPRPHRVLVSRASRPARSRSGAGASAGRMQRRRVRAVSARLDHGEETLNHTHGQSMPVTML